LPDHEFYAPPAASGSGSEDLLASFGPRLFFKPIPPRPDTAFNWRSDIVAGSGVSVWRIQQSANWSYSCEPVEEDLTIAFVTSGSSDMVIGTRHVERTPSTGCVYAHSALRHCALKTNADGHFSTVVLRFDAGLVARVQTAIFGRPGLMSLDIVPTIDLSTGEGRTLKQFASTIVSGMHTQTLSRSPKAMALVTEAALQLIFESVPHRLTNQLGRLPPDVTPKHVRQAIDYMRANLHLPLTMIDIAAAIGVSDRTLQVGFRRFRDTTPAAYLRQIRLDAVHAELSSPENRLPVTEVALKWGFTHMGRFAAHYRAAFGDYPSETAKRAFAIS
jgi:AraC-like DNA-binding protein